MKNLFIFCLQSFNSFKLNTMTQRCLKISSFWRDYGISALFILLFLLIVYYRFNYTPPRLWDFNIAYYPAGRIVIENPDNLYKPYITVAGFVNLPIIAYLFTPLSLLSEYTAAVLFTLLGVLSVFLAGYFLIKITKVYAWRRTVLIALIATNVPLYNTLQMGNTTHFVLLLLLGSFVCFGAKRDIWSGVLLASAALIKIPLLFLSVYFVLRGRWRVVAAFCMTLLAVVGSSLLLFGLNLNLIWFNRCVLAFSVKAKVIGAYYVQSVDSFLIRLITNSPLDSWEPIEVGWEFKLVRYALFSLLIGGTIWVCWYLKQPKTAAEENLEFSIFLCLAVLISPISWTHYYLLLLLPFSLYIGDKLAIPKKWTWSSLMFLSILLVALPPVKSIWFNNPVFTVLARGFLVPHLFLGGILLLGILLAARWQVSKRRQLSEVI